MVVFGVVRVVYLCVGPLFTQRRGGGGGRGEGGGGRVALGAGGVGCVGVVPE